MHTIKQLHSGELIGIKYLKLSCGLTEFPNEIFSLAESLEVLDLSANRLSELPADFGRLSKLKIVFFSENLFTELPVVLSTCKELSMIGFKSNQIKYISENALPVATRWLILTNNRLIKLPKSIGNCERLQKVALAGNLLTELPTEMANCRNLELLRISANQFTALPEWLLDLPKLSWLAFAGNRFSYKKENTNALQEINWKEFEILEQLGEGASGNIYKAVWYNQNGNREVAIKVFKGEVTSDGYPEDELQASIEAGVHSSLITLLGKIKNHPQQKHGLIMELIPPTFYNLGLPPSYETCSRDTFKPGTSFSAKEILKIVTAIGSTAKHLHAQGLMHGDLYAHNSLINKNADCLMSDFGAASFYDLKDPLAKKIQQIEVRAFGCLVEDLLTQIDPIEKDLELVKILEEFKVEWMQEPVSERPLFGDVLVRLEKMTSEC